MQPTSAVSRPAWVNAMNCPHGHRRHRQEVAGRDRRRRGVRRHPQPLRGVHRGPHGQARPLDRRRGRDARRPRHVRLLLGRPQRAGATGTGQRRERSQRPALGRPRRLDRAGTRRPRPARAATSARPWPSSGATPVSTGASSTSRSPARSPATCSPQQIPLLAEEQPDLVTCGAGVNDILFSAPGKLFADLQGAARQRFPTTPSCSTCRCLPGFWGIVGRISVPYITRINRVIREVAPSGTCRSRR